MGINYERDLDRLLRQLDDIARYPSLWPEGQDPTERVLRTNGYLVVAAVNGVDYFPDFDRVPFAAAMIQKMYRSLSRQLYDKVAESLDVSGAGSKSQLISEWTLNSTIPIPPAAAIVLYRARAVEEIPQRLLEVRMEFEGFRRHLGNFRTELQLASTVKERQRLQRHYQQLLAAASGEGHEIASVSEMLNFAEKLIPVAAVPILPTSYSAMLISQPAQWLRRWWQQRPLAVLFRLDGKLPRIGEYAELIARLWGAEINSKILDQYAVHSARVQRLMASQAG